MIEIHTLLALKYFIACLLKRPAEEPKADRLVASGLLRSVGVYEPGPISIYELAKVNKNIFICFVLIELGCQRLLQVVS